MFSLRKLQKMLDFEMYVGQMWCDGKMYCICGTEEIMYLLILCGVFFCPIAIIFILYLSFSCHLHMDRGACGTTCLVLDHIHHVAEGI